MKPRIMWAVTDGTYFYAVSPQRNLAIKDWLRGTSGENSLWKHWATKGYRCIKVSVREEQAHGRD